MIRFLLQLLCEHDMWPVLASGPNAGRRVCTRCGAVRW